MNNQALEDAIVDALKTVYDPEIPVDVYELGLIYEITINDDQSVNIDMTLTSPNCPVAESLPKEIEEAVMTVMGVKTAEVKVVFEPPWDQNMMSEEAKLELGFL
ncbi:MAG TPA: SUF system Fe-S cluster assembly protein [Brumimicrobium sp.]|nr:SUF system Fe-S cluster assembly protein [Brumimicrobium sp.]